MLNKGGSSKAITKRNQRQRSKKEHTLTHTSYSKVWEGRAYSFHRNWASSNPCYSDWFSIRITCSNHQQHVITQCKKIFSLSQYFSYTNPLNEFTICCRSLLNVWVGSVNEWKTQKQTWTLGSCCFVVVAVLSFLNQNTIERRYKTKKKKKTHRH